ncbi:hypothetical protein HOV23_gp023 [Pseudomonas phage Lana]|uniref:Holin n=1 Tax=Pseudomonas phage Lana TaxID=2530172 RepID=A0A481W711_9CAUD|nr:hypothetical protein HOV23_gp023 [Pseudomonas phage Lana]QBJ04550.1 hypothetical protein [Pseudomonas phage Lana]
MYGEVLLSIRIALHMVTFFSVICYSSEHRTRPFSSVLALLLAGTSLALAMQGYTGFAAIAANSEIWLVLFVGVVTILVVANGGNVAKVLHNTRKRLPYGR